jgi:peptidoglycan/LPS O-acetylase OafA/YrhL
MVKEDPVNAQAAPKPKRQYDIDWLRVLAVLLLFPFHSARIFDTLENFYVKNDPLSDALTYFLMYVWPWFMPLFFLLAGAGTWFALRRRSGGQYAKERTLRLLIPFIFGVLVVVPPQMYFGLLHHADANPSYLDWYFSAFTFHPEDPDGYFLGGISIGQLWFILLLYLFSLIALPLFTWLRGDSGRRAIDKLAGFCSRRGMILLLALPLLVAGLFPDFAGKNPVAYILFFIYGFILVADARFGEAIDRHKTIALILGPVLYLVVPYFDLVGWPQFTPRWSVPFLTAYIKGLIPWFSLVAILGFARKYLTQSNKFLAYFGEGGYALYILHQTFIVAIGFYVVQWAAGIAVKYVVIIIAAFVVSVVVYDLLVRRTNVTRFLFGMRPVRKAAPEAPAAPQKEAAA